MWPVLPLDLDMAEVCSVQVRTFVGLLETQRKSSATAGYLQVHTDKVQLLQDLRAIVHTSGRQDG